MKPIVHIIAAARPNFMKAAPLWHAMVRDGAFDARLVHTGQHYDENMSGVFFRELDLPDPHHHLNVGSGRQGSQTAAVIDKYESLCLDVERPDWTVVIGDVNSTVGAAMAAAKLGIRIAHLEAGLRSFDRTMPEEINRLMTDAISDLLWTPSEDGDANLLREGVHPEKITRIGNIMIDSYELQRGAIEKADMAGKQGLAPGNYGVVTLHRPANVDTAEKLAALVDRLLDVAARLPLIWPVHPRTRGKLAEFGLAEKLQSRVKVIDPLGYVPFMSLVRDSALVLTDSGGVQEETTYLGIPCLTLRPNTERPATIHQGTNRLITPDVLRDEVEKILSGQFERKGPPPLWDGRTAARAVDSLKQAASALRPEKAAA